MAKAATYEDVIKTIAKNYQEIEQSIVNQLLLNNPNHYPTEGSYRETVWKSLFEMIIPRKYCIEKGVFIIDSFGHKSKEVDLAIYDEVYTPYIFNYGQIKFIPIEAVAAVVQCKSRTLKEKIIIDWIGAIDLLITSMDSVARMANIMVDNKQIPNGHEVTQTATRPIKILCSLAGKNKLKDYEDMFDIILSVDTKNRKLIKSIRNENQSLKGWNSSLNHSIENVGEAEDKKYRVGIMCTSGADRVHLLKDLAVRPEDEKRAKEENVILSLIFQLNQLLMVINNPMLFPHRAYAERFREILYNSPNKGEETDGQQGE